MEHSETDTYRFSERLLHYAELSGSRQMLDHPSGQAIGVGQCGDSIDVRLNVESGRISAIDCQPHGCMFTAACSSAAGQLAFGKTVEEALEITPEDVEAELGGLPEDHKHCARLAINTLGEAISEYLRAEAMKFNHRGQSGFK